MTVLANRMEPEFPEIARLTELEPMISAQCHIDREATAAAFTRVSAHTMQICAGLRLALPASNDRSPLGMACSSCSK